MTHKTIQKLQLKAQDKGRMPSIKEIANMLSEFGIDFTMRNKTNVVEFRSKGCRVVNSRHDGKEGRFLIIQEPKIELDSSSSYYSWSSKSYAEDILYFLHTKNLV